MKRQLSLSKMAITLERDGANANRSTGYESSTFGKIESEIKN
jgi:hypothetical protein